MYVPEKMKVNRFVNVRIPSNAEYFGRFGQFNPENAQYTGDEIAPMSQSKVDQIEDYRRYAESMANSQHNDAEA